MEVYSIDEVVCTNPLMRETTRLGPPIHTYRHQTRSDTKMAFWSATRRMNQLGERQPSRMDISVVDVNGRITDPEADVLTARCTCTNFDLPSRVTFGAAAGDFEAAGFAAAKQIVFAAETDAELRSAGWAGAVVAA